MNWSYIGAMGIGGVWTLIVLFVGVGLGRQPFVTPKDPRELKR